MANARGNRSCSKPRGVPVLKTLALNLPMKLVRHYFQCAAVLLLASNPLVTDAATAPSPVNQMSQAAIQSAFQVLRRDYIRREDLTFTEINRAALDGLLARLNFGAEFVREVKDAAPPAARVISENLTSTIGYLRPTTCQPAEVEMIQKSLAEFEKNQVKATVETALHKYSMERVAKERTEQDKAGYGG